MQRWGRWGQWSNMVPNNCLLQTTSLCLPLCLLYPAHPRAFPNHHSFPSISLPPLAILSPHPHPPEWGGERLGKLSTSFFCVFLSSFPLFFSVVTIYHWIKNILWILTPENILCLLLQYLVRIKEHVFVQLHLCHCQPSNISHQPQHCLFWLNRLSHLCATHLGFEPKNSSHFQKKKKQGEKPIKNTP